MKQISDISILMISMDVGLLKAEGAGDVLERHKNYAKQLKRLDIIVFGDAAILENKVSDNFVVYGVGKNIFSFFKAYSLAKRLYKKNKYDLTDTQDPHWTGMLGLKLKKKFDTKLEVHFHGDFWKNSIWLKESWKNKIYNIFQKKVAPQADAIRVVNPKIKEKLLVSKIPANKIEVINTPINDKEFAQVASQEEIDKIKNKYNKKILFFVGRLVPAKNLLFLLEVVKLLSRKRQDFVLLIAGQGSEKSRVENFINNNDLEDFVFLIGSKTHKELINYFQASYLHLLFSTNESFGKTIVEAGMSSLPTLASDTLGASFIIEDGKNGWLVKIDDLLGTVDSLDKLLSHQEDVERAGQIAKKNFVDSYGREQTFMKIKNFWEKIVNGQI